MRDHCRRIRLLALALALSAAGEATADEGCCAHCGRRGACGKVCRLVLEEKKVEITCWGCKSEDFCVPGPSQPGCRHCDEACGPCDAAGNPQGVCARPKRFTWTEWIPGCAEIYTRTKLMRKTVVRKAPSYKWVVEDLCDHCEARCAGADIQPGAEIPPPPVAGVTLKYGAAASRPATK
jgi:hypothetical protein